jgi:predicted ribosome quality control (RQC) complex YloA/Tae2 family protein
MRYLKSFNESKLDKPNYKKLDIDGFLVYQGKDAKANDYITFELSSDEDYWFHAKGVPGSHILIKVKDKIPTMEVIRKAAQVAAKNSKSNDEKVLIVYCKKKFVKKEPGMNPGQVKVDHNNAYEITVSKK